MTEGPRILVVCDVAARHPTRRPDQVVAEFQYLADRWAMVPSQSGAYRETERKLRARNLNAADLDTQRRLELIRATTVPWETGEYSELTLVDDERAVGVDVSARLAAGAPIRRVYRLRCEWCQRPHDLTEQKLFTALDLARHAGVTRITLLELAAIVQNVAQDRPPRPQH